MRITALLSLLLISNLASANTPSDLADLKKSYEKCFQHASRASEMNRCAEEGYQKADALLNSVYGKAVSSLSHAARKDPGAAEVLRRLKRSQRIWITYRDANCELLSTQSFGDGHDESLSRTGCLVDETMNRIDLIEGVVNDRVLH